ncbi:unnamed protein product [Moneuplotes crassus]|uniref:Trafficking protein particle complex subunit n=1 Tax=Euplotes crassus TaxID=5936 RepID=A0AAD1Y2X0_EUPCR|nr:unnamed protein product [Moneuplotes crassus]
MYAKSISKPKPEINLSCFSFLFSEIFQYLSKNDKEKDIEQSLIDFANPIGERVLELAMYREKTKGKRYTNIVDVLHFIRGPVWKLLFGKMAEDLQQSSEDEDVYFIKDLCPITNKYTCTRDSINCAAFIAGIIEGVLCSIDFPAKVVPHFAEDDDEFTDSTLFQIKFTKGALEYEARYSGDS